jgi:hypothetical protein
MFRRPPVLPIAHNANAFEGSLLPSPFHRSAVPADAVGQVGRNGGGAEIGSVLLLRMGLAQVYR